MKDDADGEWRREIAESPLKRNGSAERERPESERERDKRQNGVV